MLELSSLEARLMPREQYSPPSTQSFRGDFPGSVPAQRLSCSGRGGVGCSLEIASSRFLFFPLAGCSNFKNFNGNLHIFFQLVGKKLLHTELTLAKITLLGKQLDQRIEGLSALAIVSCCLPENFGLLL